MYLGNIYYKTCKTEELKDIFFLPSGLPAEWYCMYVDFQFQNFETCAVVQMTMYVSHFLSNLVSLSVIGAMTVHRYVKLKKQETEILKKHTTQYILVAVIIGITSVLPVGWELWRYLNQSGSECKVSSLRTPLQCDSVLKPCSTFITVVMATLIITFSSVAIGRSTRMLRRFIKDADQRAAQILKQDRQTDTSRVRATVFLWYAFSIEWIPYGLSRFVIFLETEKTTFYSVTKLGHALSTLAFVTVPIVYLKIDNRFSRYVVTRFTKSETHPK